MDCKHKDDKKPINCFIVKQEGRQKKTFFSADMRIKAQNKGAKFSSSACVMLAGDLQRCV